MLKVFFSILIFVTPATFATTFSNIESIKQNVGFSDFYYLGHQSRKVKVAVLDKGFFGYENLIGKTLPSDTKYHAGPVPAPAEPKVEHGTIMAEIVTTLMTDSFKKKQFMPELHLYNVYGYSNFKAAIDDLIEQQIEIVLYSEVWEYGGNFDGHGFINKEVTRATDAGVIWINAAGNFGATTYNSSIRTNEDNWVKLPCENEQLEVRCANTKGDCQARLVLSWTDFKDDVELGTAYDLDFALSDGFKIVQESSLIQSVDPKENRAGYTKYPREIITANLKNGLYFVRIKDRSKNFDENMKLRVSISGDFVELPPNCQQGNTTNRSEGESLLNPADNPNVITVGASDTENTSTSRRLNKPEIWTDSSIRTGQDEYRGSSNSAAIVAAGVALMKNFKPSLTREQVLSYSMGQQPSQPGNQPGRRPAGWNLGFGYTGPGCFIEPNNMQIPDYLRPVLSQGGRIVETTAGIKVIVEFDPFLLAPYMFRRAMDDIFAVGPYGYVSYPRPMLMQIPWGTFEIFERAAGIRLCSERGNQGSQRSFHLPTWDF